jgi:tetratricopeptide (TPR) repeat protein
MTEDVRIMASKRSRKVRKRKKVLQRRRQQLSNKRRHLPQIPPENADQVAMTTTGEIMQPIRLHYEVFDSEQLRATFATLRCLDDDTPRGRWVWLYTDEAGALSFEHPSAADNVVLGEFVFKGSHEVVLNLRSLERATQALAFFDKYISRTVARVIAVTVSNRLLSLAEASALISLDHFFDRADVVVKDPASLLQSLEDLKSNIPDERERRAAVMQYLDDRAKQPVPAMERFPFDYADYDAGGIRAIEAFLAPHTVIAMQHWQGNTDYTRHDLMRSILRDGAIPSGETRTTMSESLVNASLPTQLSSLMDSESYEDWLRAWELIRDHLPDDVTTFRECEVRLGVDAHGFFVNNLLYDLDIALQNDGLDDLSLMEKRAEVARWVHTHFTAEDELTLGNFRGYEAESLWEMGKQERAEALFQALTDTFPNFAWGYIWWGDCYWMSDWSYENEPDYDRAESLYRQALANPNLEDRGDVQDRLDDLNEEKAHPEKRERIKQVRLKRIQSRKRLE